MTARLIGQCPCCQALFYNGPPWGRHATTCHGPADWVDFVVEQGRVRAVATGHPCTECAIRDGVTGSTPGFGPGNRGSSPRPEATVQSSP